VLLTVECPAEVVAPHATILIVDDNPTNLRMLARTLEGQGYRLLAARSGRAALEIAAQARPDLVLLDVMMPEMDGFAVCRALKAGAATREAVVIFLSAIGEVADKVMGLAIGAADYVTKPIQAEEVLARVANHLARQRLEREVRRGRDELERELARAAGMQRSLLPARLPAGASVTFAAHYRTSRYAGGDYYDVLELGDGRYGVFVADVSGHGAHAAIVMAMIRAVVHTYPAAGFDPASVLQHVNRHFAYLWETPMFATAVCGVIDERAASMTLVCAGHHVPLLLRGGRVTPLPVDATLMLLMFELPHIPQTSVRLQPGDRILLYTDGVTERSGPDDEMYDVDRLQAALAASGAADAETTLDAIVRDVDGFADGCEANDDQTLLLVAVD
jgi:phosphoserine phosphatase RsbU/P